MPLDEFKACFESSMDIPYLELHFPRFQRTLELARESWKWDEARVLDIGAHWLHQALLWAQEGHHVTAADLALPLADPSVLRVASRHGIRLLVYDDLGSEHALDELEDNSQDVILFCEVLEHLTFNPVGMWKAFYRVLRPGGRIIVTTPNHYALGRLKDLVPRFLAGHGAGVSVEDILHTPTNSAHWKEYSRKEVKRYFELLTRDFSVGRQVYFSTAPSTDHLNWKGKLKYGKINMIPIFRPGLYTEVDLAEKKAGITISPSWH